MIQHTDEKDMSVIGGVKNSTLTQRDINHMEFLKSITQPSGMKIIIQVMSHLAFTYSYIDTYVHAMVLAWAQIIYLKIHKSMRAECPSASGII